jgi:hypothetical protein
MSIRIRSRFLRAAVFAVLASVLFALPQTLRAADLISGVEASLSGEPLQPAFGTLPLPDFIQRLFGDSLGLDIVIAPELRAEADPVSLRL